MISIPEPVGVLRFIIVLSQEFFSNVNNFMAYMLKKCL